MKLLKYKAINLKGEKVNGIVEAESIEDLLKNLRKNDLYLLKYSEKKSIKNVVLKKIITLKDLSNLIRRLAVSLESGILLSSALESIIYQSNNKFLRNNLWQIYKSVKNGRTLAYSLQCFKDIYPSFIINMISIGEQIGKLPEMCYKISEYLDREDKFRNKIKGALAYPIFLIFLTFIITIFLMINIVPVFTEALQASGGNVPIITKKIMTISRFCVKHPLILLFCILTFIIGITTFIKDEDSKIITKLKLNMPFYGKIYKDIVQYKIAYNLSVLISSGISILNCSEIIKTSIPNTYIRKTYERGINKISKGEGISEAFKNTKIFDEVFISFINTGEQTGKMDEMLLKLSKVYSEQIDYSIEKLTNMIQPILIVIISFIIGGILASVLLPMINMMNIIGS